MKSMLLLGLLLVVAPISYAGSAVPDADPCSKNDEVMRNFMIFRQYGVKKEKAYQIIESQTTDQRLRSAFKFAIDDAYRRPVYPGKAEKQRAIEEFVSHSYLMCVAGY